MAVAGTPPVDSESFCFSPCVEAGERDYAFCTESAASGSSPTSGTNNSWEIMNGNLMRALIAFVALWSNPVPAQDSDEIDWKIAPYLWAMSLTGSVGIGDLTHDFDARFKDVVSDLDIGGSIYTEVGKDRHSAHFDYTYIRLSPSPTQLSEDSRIESTMTINFFEPAYNFRWNGANGHAFVVGARYIDMKLKLEAELGDSQSRLLEAGPDWWDFFVGIKTRTKISANWDLQFYGTIGTGASDLPWSAQAIFARRLSNENRLGLGLRIWGVNFSEDLGPIDNDVDIDTVFYGLAIGYEFN